MVGRKLIFTPLAIPSRSFIFINVTGKHDGSGRRKEGGKDNLKVRGIAAKGQLLIRKQRKIG